MSAKDVIKHSSFNFEGNERYKRTEIYSMVKLKNAGKGNSLLRDFEKGYRRRPQFNRNKYTEMLHRNLRDNLMIGFKSENSLKEVVEYNEEVGAINRLREKLNLQSKSFNMFVESDYKSTKALCIEAENKRRVNHEKTETLENTINNLQTLQHEISILQDRYDKCKTCERFLYSISPNSWKENYNLKYGSIDEALTKEADTDMYFKETAELFMIFNELEEYCFTDTLVLQKLEETAENLMRETEPIDRYYKELIEYLEEKINRKEESIKAFEKGRMDAESHANEMIHNSSASMILSNKEYHLTFAYLQDHFNQCFNISNPDLSILEMFQALEAEQKRLQFEEDSFNSAHYHALTKKVHAQEQAQLSLAKRSRKLLMQFDTSAQKLMGIYEPSKQTTTRKMMFRSNIIDKLSKPESKPHFKSAEKLLQHFFADENYCDPTTDQNLNLDTLNKYLLDEKIKEDADFREVEYPYS
ncbi:hypothetical protein LSTR_LSTR005080 [Laodelphax striatellus]|uniref:DUF4200 domain-containing protein n=1 Tax=Laodelphax striatellus TaxID=195883 RepID=A0A482WT62_LAOST|nr:hypothetical protein LSTR_LSTR005080 [Laodelphax striatellus]